MHVAVCIVSFRNPQDIVRCLAALAHTTVAYFEVVICENGGVEAYTHLTTAVPAKLPGGQPVKVVNGGGNIGYAGGVNRALAATPDADAWWVLNPDTEPQAGALQALLDRLAVGDCDLVGGTTYTSDGRVESRAGGWAPWFARTRSIGSGELLEAPADVAAVENAAAYVSGACMLVSRRFLKTVGPMREDFFLYCEEVEWCLRGRDNGLRLGYAEPARVLHHKGTTTGSVADMRQRPRIPVYLDERNKLILTWVRNPWRLITAAPSALLILCIRFGKRRAWRQLGYAFAGWAAGVRNERGAPAWLR
jgi:N-acetylglucosaminyl-diphospho-decaprenol L-rhamnosyltransferase